MKREVVQDFLNLPGIAGIALMDGRSRPYFFGLDQTLNFQQREALAQGIQQVIDTTPSGFESFEFLFSNYSVYIYKLEQGAILLVLTNENLDITSYMQGISLLKDELLGDITKAVATFRLLAGSISLSGQSYWGESQSQAALSTSGSTTQSNATVAPAQRTPPTPKSNQASVMKPPNLGEVLSALNSLSQYASQYLGKAVVSNYWKTSRPDLDWLDVFQIERTGNISLAPSSQTSLQEEIENEHQKWIKMWVTAFVTRCARVIRDFPVLMEQEALDERQRYILLSDLTVFPER
ncbi:MAG: hypothetical protein ACTS2F_00710 [Thainema sp.]